jgi:hypothetical protein
VVDRDAMKKGEGRKEEGEGRREEREMGSGVGI